jgi:hypothetical protein
MAELYELTTRADQAVPYELLQPGAYTVLEVFSQGLLLKISDHLRETYTYLDNRFTDVIKNHKINGASFVRLIVKPSGDFTWLSSNKQVTETLNRLQRAIPACTLEDGDYHISGKVSKFCKVAFKIFKIGGSFAYTKECPLYVYWLQNMRDMLPSVDFRLTIKDGLLYYYQIQKHVVIT